MLLSIAMCLADMAESAAEDACAAVHVWMSIWGELCRMTTKRMHVALAKYSWNSGKLVKIMDYE